MIKIETLQKKLAKIPVIQMETTTPLQRTIRDLEIAKENVLWLLENVDGLVDMHGIVYWAGRIELLREAIKKHI